MDPGFRRGDDQGMEDFLTGSPPRGESAEHRARQQHAEPSFQFFSQDITHPAERRIRGGNAGIDRRLHHEGPQLLGRDAVLQRRAEVELELLLAMERHHHGKRQHRSRLPRQRRIAPDLAPGDARDEVLPRHGEPAGAGQRTLDMFRAEDGLAMIEPAPEVGRTGRRRDSLALKERGDIGIDDVRALDDQEMRQPGNDDHLGVRDAPAQILRHGDRGRGIVGADHDQGRRGDRVNACRASRAFR